MCLSNRENCIINNEKNVFKYRNEREKYHLHPYKARKHPEKYLTIIIDGTDQSKTDIPNVHRICKSTANLQKLHTHLTRAIVHILALLSHTQQQMQEKTNDVATTSAQIGLNIHRGKTKVLKVNADNSHPIKLDEQVLEEVEAFTYLGSVVDKQGCTDADVRARIGKARAVFVQLKNIWSSKELSLKTKVRLFNTNIKSVLLYGSETWRTTVATIKRVQTFINTCLRKILQIRWPDTISNKDL